jgi:hypothetical protein
MTRDNQSAAEDGSLGHNCQSRSIWHTVKAKVILNNFNYNNQLEDLYFWKAMCTRSCSKDPTKSAEDKTILKLSLSRQICHQLQVKGSRPPILYEKCVQKCLLRPIHNYIQSHTNHPSKHLVGILGSSRIVITCNPLCSHLFLYSQLHIL